MQDELAYLIERGMNRAKFDDDVPAEMIRSAAWLVAMSKAYSGNYPVKQVVNPSQIIQAWSVKKDGKQYAATFKIAIDTSEAIAAVEVLGKKIKDVINSLSIEDEIKKYELSHLTTRSMDKEMVERIRQIVDKAAKHCLDGRAIPEQNNKISEATFCSVESSGSIEQQALSTVLGNTLHSIPVSNASSVAVELAQAVKAAFDVLENKNATPR